MGSGRVSGGSPAIRRNVRLVTCAGIDLGAAKARLRMMHGKRRVPTLLKLVARIAKTAAAE